MMRLELKCAVGALLLGLPACLSGMEPVSAKFDRGATLGLVQALSADELGGRGTGSPGSAAARDLIEARMVALGLQTVNGSFRQNFTYVPQAEGDGETAPLTTGVNMLARLDGTGDSDLVMVVSSHYDHLGILDGKIYNGADDNASGVAAMLAVGEHFAAHRPRHDVILVAFDAEETGYGGARAFVRDPPAPLSQLAFNLNLDMVARGDNGILWASGTAHWPGLVALVDEVGAEAKVVLKRGFDTGDGRDDWTLLSDHSIFFEAGIPHLYLGVEDHADYHEPTDDFERIDQAWFLDSVETIVMLASAADAQLAGIEALAGEQRHCCARDGTGG